ncbi:MAG: hypothetical protein CM15mP109_10300 [Candidatus Dadabacteria bacterium]|nr:MAG: hypothetical protein CM15mP109_10300 [Candidatus Dadabacteria bacterium]
MTLLKLQSIFNIDNFIKKGFLVIGLDELGESNLNEVKIDSNQPKVLVMGSEGKGLRRLTKTKCDIWHLLKIKPMIISPLLMLALVRPYLYTNFLQVINV